MADLHSHADYLPGLCAACQPGEMLYCPGACPGGCGYQFDTPRGCIYLPVILRQCEHQTP